MEYKTYSIEEFGDFQTPMALVRAIISRLARDGWKWGRVLEPTCGEGNFIKGIVELEPNTDEIVGIELQENHAKSAKKLESNIPKILIQILNQSIFSINLSEDLVWQSTKPLLVLGNLPWVTNSKMGSINGTNLPIKSNIKKLNGIDALTGASNFDISEYILIKIINELSHQKPTVAILCKTSVARKIVSFAHKNHLCISDSKIIRIDTKKWFNASADACLFVFSLGHGLANYDVQIYDSLENTIPTKLNGFHNGQLISDKSQYLSVSHLDGQFPFEWRSGIKHDAASIVELVVDKSGNFRNKNWDIVCVEEEYVFPFFKSSDLSNGKITLPSRWILLPQKKLHEDTTHLSKDAPKLWAYLSKHLSSFRGRKSVIYQNKPDFSYFGLGNYTFSDYKVAVSGLYKEPVFRVLGSYSSKPAIVDDTCYFVSCASAAEATKLANYLNQQSTLDFLEAITFKDSMRPLTKSVLQRISVPA